MGVFTLIFFDSYIRSVRGLFFLIWFFVLVSCSNDGSEKESISDVQEFDTCFWTLSSVVVDSDTFSLDLAHHLFRIGDSTVKEWKFLNDTLSYLTSSETCRSFVLANDSILIPITCTNFPYTKLQTYELIDGHGEIEGVRIIHSLDDYYDVPYKAIIKRESISLAISNNLLEIFDSNPDTLIYLR